MTNPKDTGANGPKRDLSSDLGNLEDDEFLVEDETTTTEDETTTTEDDAVDPQDPATDDPDDDELADDDLDADAADEEIEVATIDDDDEVPYELREDRQDPATEPRTGLVSEFRDLTGRQAAWLVSNRETTTASRSPLFYVTALVIGLAVLAGLVIGLGNADSTSDGSDTAVAVVGIGEQAPLFEQQLGMTVLDAESVEVAQEMVRNGEVDAALIPDVTGQGNDTIVALNSEPTAVLDKFAPQMPVTYLEPPAVNTEAAKALGWGLAFLLIASVMTLGALLYSNMRVEKRNRIAEIIAATIPAKSAAWGRVYGLTLLSLGYLAIAVGVLLLGLSIASRTSLAVSMMPGLGWFAGLFLLAHLLFLSLYLWAATAAKRRGRQVGAGLTVILVLGGALAPLFFLNNFEALKWMSWIPFTAPVATPLRYFASQAEWWEGLIALGSVLVAALIAFALASAAYRRNLLRGSGRTGKTAKVKGDRSKGAETEDGDDDAAETSTKDAKSSKGAKAATGAKSAKSGKSGKSTTAGRSEDVDGADLDDADVEDSDPDEDAAEESTATTAKSTGKSTGKPAPATKAAKTATGKSAAKPGTAGKSGKAGSSAASKRKKPGAR
ncbi:ABC transporter permease [Nocardia zapadnayensis]|uniref:ABC transporter permease n=1 Tax=Brevibacterium sp. NPDC049920 TaxID=3155279 RepID=UPI00224706D5|nr:ABC transporter permease [Nocardia zapadnayensis]MCX0277402.1 ABC transporter permease [Nocardia zapadnayensis]